MQKKIAVVVFLFGGLFFLLNHVGSGPYDSEGEAATALEKYIDEACECGEARHKYFSSDIKSGLSGCDSVSNKVSKTIQRYEETPDKYKTHRIEQLYDKLFSCHVYD